MSIFEEMEEYWNDIPKVKRKLKDYDRDIVWEGNVFLRNGSDVHKQGPFVFTYNGGFYHVNQIDINGKIDVVYLTIGGLENMLCEKLQIINRKKMLAELELYEAKVPANTHLIRAFAYKTLAEREKKNNFHKWKAYLGAGLAIKDCEYEIASGKEAMKLNGVGKSSAELVDKALADDAVVKNVLGVAEKFFDIAKSKGVRKAYASLPKDAEITLDTDGVLRVNGNIKEDFHARGCPFETEIDGVKYIVDGTANYDGFGDYKAYAGLKFSGTLTHLKNKKEYNFSFSYESKEEGYEDLPVDWEGDFEEDEQQEIKDALNDEVFSSYEWNYIE